MKKKINVTIPTISCKHCVQTIEQELKQLETVKIRINLKKKTAKIEFDDSKLSTIDILAAIEHSGYTAKEV